MNVSKRSMTVVRQSSRAYASQALSIMRWISKAKIKNLIQLFTLIWSQVDNLSVGSLSSCLPLCQSGSAKDAPVESCYERTLP